ncbi:TPA: DUF429 domain-containing protein [Methanosarcinaceae archaeon]|nr:DUF429 domain-containing protein [Methanosarcinaceae archaeon]
MMVLILEFITHSFRLKAKTMQEQFSRSLIYGIDFSGSQEACKKIWICESVPTNKGLQIQKCGNIKKKHGNISLEKSLEMLRNFIESKNDAVFGLDFPFGLPECLLRENTWESFIRRFHEQYKDPAQFYDVSHSVVEKEPKRLTDVDAKSPWSPIFIQLHKQTYYGINSVLYPLILNNSANIHPMQSLEESKPWVIEICPASTLKCEHLDCSFKKKGKEAKVSENNRKLILQGLVEKERITNISPEIWDSVVNDREGDALDSIIAAVATYRAMRNNLDLPDNELYKLEGYIYV